MPSTYELASGRKIEGLSEADVFCALVAFQRLSSPYSWDKAENMDAMALAIEAALRNRELREHLLARFSRESGQDVPAVEPLCHCSIGHCSIGATLQTTNPMLSVCPRCGGYLVAAAVEPVQSTS